MKKEKKQRVPPVTGRLLTVKETAEYLGMSVDWIYLQKSSGKLPFIQIGRAVRFKLSDLELFIESRRTA